MLTLPCNYEVSARVQATLSGADKEQAVIEKPAMEKKVPQVSFAIDIENAEERISLINHTKVKTPRKCSKPNNEFLMQILPFFTIQPKATFDDLLKLTKEPQKALRKRLKEYCDYDNYRRLYTLKPHLK